MKGADNYLEEEKNPMMSLSEARMPQVSFIFL